MTPAAVTVNRVSDDEAGTLVGGLAGELESFAFERERVLAKLDIRAAGLARRIARELRVVLRGLPLATSDESRDGVMATLGGLLEEAHRLLENRPEEREHAAEPQEETEPREENVQESGERRRTDLRDPAMPLRETVNAMPAVKVPNLDRYEHDPEESPRDLTIARRVVWERGSNRLLGR